MEDPDVVDRGEGGEGPHPKCYPKPHLSSQLYLITPHENPKTNDLRAGAGSSLAN